ncbi:MAG: signal peptidase I [Lentisphaerae bacterium]|nr:signal peptidase I [Lentisphaerota bacterium]
MNRRKARKTAKHCLHHARHSRNMREDIAPSEAVANIYQAEQHLAVAITSGDIEQMERMSQQACEAAAVVLPPKSFAAFRENLEILVVAIAVAMAFRTYFIQPFKIPTGSMQPSLYGITSVAQHGAGLMDRPVLKNLKWAVTGDFYHEYRAKVSGTVGQLMEDQWDPSIVRFTIGGKMHKVPIDAYHRQELKVLFGEYVARGTLLWSGIRKSGDHVFVDKVRWNFFPPRRGDIMVFSTDRIPTLPQGSHYIKRLVGLPGETIGVHPPDLIVNGEAVYTPASIERIATKQPGYDGYALADPRARDGSILSSPDDTITLSPAEYLAMGDNTLNSRDSRYWGSVPQANMVGPAAIVYWPIGKRWGLAR